MCLPQHNPTKLDDVVRLVSKYKGREEALLQALRRKYDVDADGDTACGADGQCDAADDGTDGAKHKATDWRRGIQHLAHSASFSTKKWMWGFAATTAALQFNDYCSSLDDVRRAALSSVHAARTREARTRGAPAQEVRLPPDRHRLIASDLGSSTSSSAHNLSEPARTSIAQEHHSNNSRGAASELSGTKGGRRPFSRRYATRMAQTPRPPTRRKARCSGRRRCQQRARPCKTRAPAVSSSARCITRGPSPRPRTGEWQVCAHTITVPMACHGLMPSAS